MNYHEIAAYHRQHGDDYKSDDTRHTKYRVILELANFAGRHVLDVGCGHREFRQHLPRCHYTGIDLTEGDNVLDHHTHYDLVVANGIFYKLNQDAWDTTLGLIGHMWTLTRQALIFNSLSSWAAKQQPGEFHIDPLRLLRHCRMSHTDRLTLRHDYAPGDFTIALYR